MAGAPRCRSAGGRPSAAHVAPTRSGAERSQTAVITADRSCRRSAAVPAPTAARLFLKFDQAFRVLGPRLRACELALQLHDLLRGCLCARLGPAGDVLYRHRNPQSAAPRAPRVRTSPRALTVPERETVLAVLHEPRFLDLAPAQVYAQLLDEGTYHCAARTMYRVLAAQAGVRERRAQRRHPAYAAHELLATAPISCGVGTSPSSRAR